MLSSFPPYPRSYRPLFDCRATIDRNSQGGFTQGCGGVDSNCSGFLYCNSGDFQTTASQTCGGKSNSPGNFRFDPFSKTDSSSPQVSDLSAKIPLKVKSTATLTTTTGCLTCSVAAVTATTGEFQFSSNTFSSSTYPHPPGIPR